MKNTPNAAREELSDAAIHFLVRIPLEIQKKKVGSFKKEVGAYVYTYHLEIRLIFSSESSYG